MRTLVLATGIGRLADKAHAGWNPTGWVKPLPMWVSAPVGVVALLFFAACIFTIVKPGEDKDKKTIVRACLLALPAGAVAGLCLVSVLS
ncbi:hypothetical protein GCM10023195_84330 [Actinoallomurus liliacearum]|uniref:Uncharacterized protein n=1 Tax=Actinoallomurus liliacearum TaxID=1080073 RepID=A0ABP8U0F3_9ACTN